MTDDGRGDRAQGGSRKRRGTAPVVDGTLRAGKTAVMTTIAKCLVVFAVFASFAFLGFAWVSMMGGPNWDAEAFALPDYSIQKSGDKWAVTERVGGATVNVARASVEASAVIAAREDLQKKKQAE